MRRMGDFIHANATPFGGGTPSPSSVITLNLNTPELSVFRGRHKFGFVSNKQANSGFNLLSLDFPVIKVDAEDNSAVSCYDGVEAPLQSSPMELIGVGRFSHNTATRKMFYVADYGFTRI